jgi:Sugar (and other) transporter
VGAQIYFAPESPRWYMTKNKYNEAFRSLTRFRNSRLQAGRDLYYIHQLLKIENKLKEGKSLWKEFFVRPRNRRAAQSSFFVMFMQQFCGVNVIAYYSSQIFVEAGFSTSNALLASLGTGIINWLFAIPAFYTIDTFGRRNLLLTTFPLMSCFLFFTGFSFFISDQIARLGCVATGIYLFMIVYSPGEGPVPFTYSAEAFVSASCFSTFFLCRAD